MEAKAVMLQLNPPLPMTTPKGKGLAHVVIDYGPEHNLFWTVFITEGKAAGEIWTYGNPEVRAEANITLGREVDTNPVYVGGVLNTTTKKFECKFGPLINADYGASKLEPGEHLLRCVNGKRYVIGYRTPGGLYEPWDGSYEI